MKLRQIKIATTLVFAGMAASIEANMFARIRSAMHNNYTRHQKLYSRLGTCLVGAGVITTGCYLHCKRLEQQELRRQKSMRLQYESLEQERMKREHIEYMRRFGYIRD